MWSPTYICNGSVTIQIPPHWNLIGHNTAASPISILPPSSSNLKEGCGLPLKNVSIFFFFLLLLKLRSLKFSSLNSVNRRVSVKKGKWFTGAICECETTCLGLWVAVICLGTLLSACHYFSVIGLHTPIPPYTIDDVSVLWLTALPNSTFFNTGS